jgi:hypothetical protein
VVEETSGILPGIGLIPDFAARVKHGPLLASCHNVPTAKL